MEPVRFFKSINEEVEFLRSCLKTAYLDAAAPPENCADAKNILKGIRDSLKTYYEALKQHEWNEIRKEANEKR
ncbi:MAG: hypothetical protein K0Q50_228 [Vampirovibrio sp.]|jgi:hypothetical protein|nr:hypothetical protein [Vampirovibrio sp.]